MSGVPQEKTGMIASYHPLATDVSREHVVIGKTSRIQDGVLIRLHAEPRTKFEGVHVVLGICTYRRKPNGYVELVGPCVENFWRRFCEHILRPIVSTHAPKLDVPPFRVKSKNAKFFRFLQGKHVHIPEAVTPPELHGFAVIMTRGPWFHASRQSMACAWHLVEFIAIQ